MTEEIRRLAKEKDALILAHYYQRLEVQMAADIFGDSFELAKKAKLAENRMVVFCGVRFMAESAENTESRKEGPAARPGRRMPDGGHGNAGRRSGAEGEISGRGGGLLRELVGGDEGSVGHLLHVLERREGREEPAEQADNLRS